MLTNIQIQIIQTLVKNRGEHSYLTGGSLINRNLPRLSDDIDIFNDHVDICVQAFQADTQILKAAGFQISIIQEATQERPFGSVMVSNTLEKSRIDWASDSPFRFFPAVNHPEFGFKLHDCDLIINKILAAASRNQVRDYYDICAISAKGFDLIPCLWAACGKDAGFTPDMILENMIRNSHYSKPEFDTLKFSENSLTPSECTKIFTILMRDAKRIFLSWPIQEAGVLFLDKKTGETFSPAPQDFKEGRVFKNAGAVYGQIQDEAAETAATFTPSYQLKF